MVTHNWYPKEKFIDRLPIRTGYQSSYNVVLDHLVIPVSRHPNSRFEPKYPSRLTKVKRQQIYISAQHTTCITGIPKLFG